MNACRHASKERLFTQVLPTSACCLSCSAAGWRHFFIAEPKARQLIVMHCCFLLIALVCRLYCTVDMLNQIPPFRLHHLLHKPQAPSAIPIELWVVDFPRTGKLSFPCQFPCQLQSTQLCTIQGQRRFVLCESTQEWCSFTLSDSIEEPAHRGLTFVDSQAAQSTSVMYKMARQTRMAQSPFFYYCSLEECATSSKTARGYILPSAQMVA